MTAESPRPDTTGLREVIADGLTRSGFMGWLLSSGDSALWAERTPEQEIGRVAADVASDWLACIKAEAVEQTRAHWQAMHDEAMAQLRLTIRELTEARAKCAGLSDLAGVDKVRSEQAHTARLALVAKVEGLAAHFNRQSVVVCSNCMYHEHDVRALLTSDDASALDAVKAEAGRQALLDAASDWWARGDVDDRHGPWSWLRVRAAQIGTTEAGRNE